jgi:DNA-binding GntR family transcriptional regulator
VDELGDAARDQRDPEAIVALDLAFHRHLCHLAGHSRLVAAWNRLQLQTQMLIGWTSKTHYPQPDQPRETHQRIVDALREKDMELGKRYLTDHLIDAQRRAMMASQSLRSGSAGGEERDY